MPLLPGDAGKYREGQITSDLAGGATYWVVRLKEGQRWWLGDRFSETEPAETDVARFATEAEAREVERQQSGAEALPVIGLKALQRIADWADDAADAARSFDAVAGRRDLHLVGSPLGGEYVVRFRDTPGRVVVDILRPISAS
jgi:hypothetical protein